MTDEKTNQDQKAPQDAAAAAKEQQEEKDHISSSVDTILQERLRLEREQAALDQMLKDKFQKNITVLFTDIKGSTSFFETYGDVEGRAMVQRHNEMLFPHIASHGGKVIKTIGDAIMATFEDPAQGVKAAIQMQKALFEHNRVQDQKHKKIMVRMGLNFGPAVVEEKDVFGDAVNVAARVESQADAEQILVSEELYKNIRTDDEILVRFFGEATVKGKAEPVKIYRVVWSDEQMVVESEFKKAATRRTVDMRGLTVKGKVIEVISSREGNKMKVSVLEHQRGEEKTVSQYDEVKLDDNLVRAQGEEIVGLLNRANKRGKITKEILKQLQAAGQILFDHLLSPEAKDKILATQAEHLVIRIDDRLVHIPWELIFDGKQFFCQRFSMGRIVSTRQRVAEVADRHIAKPLRMLVVADPRADLAASRQEGTHIRDELDKEHEFINVNLKAGDVPVNYLKSKIRDYDLIHYAGHAAYDKNDPGNSAWLLADGKLTSNDIKAMTGKKPMPALVFANGCQSGQTDEWKIESDYESSIFGLANAFLVTGVQHYIGTFWDILDDPGHDFALAFYHEMIGGATVGEAVRRARLGLIDKYGEETIVWASYMLYGDPTFSYLAEAVETREGEPVAAAAPGQAAYPVAGPGQAYVLRGAESAALPKPAGISKTTLLIVVALILVVTLGLLYMKRSGVSVSVPEDALSAGYLKLDQGDFEGALATFRALTEQDGLTRARGLEGLAAVYLQRNDLVSAEQNAREALNADPQAIYAHVILGSIAYNRGDYAVAVTEFQTATQAQNGKEWQKKAAFEKLAMALNARGLAASQSGNRDEAAKSYAAALQANPNDSQAAINMGQSYLAQGNAAKAREAFAAVVQQNPNDTVASTLLAQAENMIAFAQDAQRQAEVNRLTTELAERWRSGTIAPPQRVGDDWTSRMMTVTFLDFNRMQSKTPPLMEGEDEFLKIALMQALRATGRVEVVEREKIDRILQELNLASSALASEETKLQLGKLFGARYIATGSYIHAGADVQVNLRLIDVETSVPKVAISEIIKAPKTPADIAKAITDALIRQIKDNYPIQGAIAEVAGEQVRLNIGSKVGLVPGMKLSILDENQLKIGTLEIVEAAPDVAVAKVIEKPTKLLAKAMKVRELVAAAKPAAPAPPVPEMPPVPGATAEPQ